MIAERQARWALAVLAVGCSHPGTGAQGASDHVPAFHSGVGYLGLATHVVLAVSGRSVQINGDVDGLYGLGPGETRGALALPEAASSVLDILSGLLVLTPSGRVYATGAARPGEDCELGMVTLPGAVEHLVGAAGVACAALRGGGTYCWGEVQQGGLCRGSPPRLLTGVPPEVRELATDGRRVCVLSGRGVLRCAGRDGTGEFAPLGDVANGVLRIAGGQGRVCYVQGPERRLRCFGPNDAAPMDLGLRDVSSFDVGERVACAVGTLRGQTDRWVYCWGLAFLRHAWINVGPHGIDPGTVPENGPHFVTIHNRPWPVVPSPADLRVHVLGLSLCVETVDRAVACDGAAQALLPASYRIGELPVGSRSFSPELFR